MKKVITYGTFDLLHEGHLKLLERAKKLGDYLIVGVTSDDFDRIRGKINVQQCLTERIEAVRATGLADMIIVEEYEGQKIDDIKRYGVDVFTVGSDWVGKFDYLNEYCEVIYLPRTEGISSTDLRTEQRHIKLGIVGESYRYLNKLQNEDKYVNGVEIIGICTNNIDKMSDGIKKLSIVTNNYDELLENVDALYIESSFKDRYNQIKKALEKGKSVFCSSPITLSKDKTMKLFELANKNNCILMDEIRTAYSVAYSRLLLLIKGGKIGNVMSIDVACTSINNERHNSLYDWGAIALLPIFHILGTNYKKKEIITHFANDGEDVFTKINFIYDNSTASLMVADGAKSEGELIITGTKGYIYVPAPWWKTDYFEIRYENQNDNKRYFYQLDGEGIRYALVAFCRAIVDKKNNDYITKDISLEISKVMEDFTNKIDVIKI